MEIQQVFNIAIGLITMGLGWILNELWRSYRSLEDKHNSHTKEVAEKYVSKEDFKDQLQHIRDTCDNIWKAIRKGE